MPGQTIKEFASKLQEAKSESFRKLNPHIFNDRQNQGVGRNAEDDSKSRPAMTAVKQSAEGQPRPSPEERLNKLERRWLAVLRTRYASPGIQNITFRLSDDLRYTPDLNSGQSPWVFFETKGPHRFREKGILKLKWAAKEYPSFDFVLVTWDKDTGWKEELMPKE